MWLLISGSVFISSTAEAVLQEMDNISSIRQNREVERLRMWTDTELVGSALSFPMRTLHESCHNHNQSLKAAQPRNC